MKRAELVLKYFMKGIDGLKRLQDSELLSSFSGSFQKSHEDAPSIAIEFPESIDDLPFDPTRNDFVTSTLSRSTLIGRNPSRKLQKTINYSHTKDNLREMERFVNVKQPWRTRTSTLARPIKTLESDTQPSRENVASLDLTGKIRPLQKQLLEAFIWPLFHASTWNFRYSRGTYCIREHANYN